MSSLFQDSKKRYTREGRAEGKVETDINHVFALVKNANMSIDEAFDVLEVPEAHRERIRPAVIERLESQS